MLYPRKYLFINLLEFPLHTGIYRNTVTLSCQWEGDTVLFRSFAFCVLPIPSIEETPNTHHYSQSNLLCLNNNRMSQAVVTSECPVSTNLWVLTIDNQTILWRQAYIIRIGSSRFCSGILTSVSNNGSWVFDIWGNNCHYTSRACPKLLQVYFIHLFRF